jgi:hypothetical protein
VAFILPWRLFGPSPPLAKDKLLEELKTEYVPKIENPPNVPQIRPIEKFWANLKKKVYQKAQNNFPINLSKI